jgi:hypothetical protein
MERGTENRKEIASKLVSAIERCVIASGHAMPSLRADQCPLTEIQGFDSLCGIEVTVDLQESLGVKLKNNVFVKADGSKVAARTLDEIVDAILKAGR